MTAFECAIHLDRVSSVAAMQEWVRNSRQNWRGGNLVTTFDGRPRRLVDFVSTNRVSRPQMPLTRCNRPARCNMMRRLAAQPPDAREEAMQWLITRWPIPTRRFLS